MGQGRAWCIAYAKGKPAPSPASDTGKQRTVAWVEIALAIKLPALYRSIRPGRG